MTDLSPLTFAFWTAVKSRPALPGEPEVVVDGWERDAAGFRRNRVNLRRPRTLTPTEQAAALWRADRWLRWFLTCDDGSVPADDEHVTAADLAIIQYRRTHRDLLTVALAVAKELNDDD